MKVNWRKVLLFLVFLFILVSTNWICNYYNFPTWTLFILYFLIFIVYEKLSSKIKDAIQRQGEQE